LVEKARSIIGPSFMRLSDVRCLFHLPNTMTIAAMARMMPIQSLSFIAVFFAVFSSLPMLRLARIGLPAALQRVLDQAHQNFI
jgi:hypothetical protein